MISIWQNDTEPYSFINNRLRASEPSFCHLSTRSLPYALPIFRWLPVHIRWKRKGNNCILCFFLHHFLQFLKEKRSLSSFLSLLKIAWLWGNEISPSPGGRGLRKIEPPPQNLALHSLTPPPCKPPKLLSDGNLTLKTCFLLALALAKRVSELCSLSSYSQAYEKLDLLYLLVHV